MTPTAPTCTEDRSETRTDQRTEARSDFRSAAAQLRTNAGLDDREAVAAVVPAAEIGAAARRLRASNTWNASLITRGQSDGARIAVGAEATGLQLPPVDPRQAAAEADRLQRHQRLAARGAALLAELEAEQAATAPPPAAPPRSLFSR